MVRKSFGDKTENLFIPNGYIVYVVSKSSRKDDAMLTWVGASREGFTNFLFFENFKSFDRWSKRSIYKQKRSLIIIG